MIKYLPEIETQMQSYFAILSERDKRHYAALESVKLGHGGQTYISQLLGISRPCISRGIKELNSPDYCTSLPVGRQRRFGGGRKKKS